jgi:hypothetical protein
MRELNEFNKNVIQTFASRQAYRQINGHYIPIIMGGISDESVVEVQRRRFYIQNYEFTMLGFLLDEDEFEVAPAVSRVLNTFEVSSQTTKPKKKRFPENKDSFDLSVTIPADVTTKQLNVDYTGDFLTQGQINIQSYDVYINNDFYGTDVRLIQVNTNDILRFEVVKKTDGEEASLQYGIKLL